MAGAPLSNEEIADRLDDLAALLRAQEANPYRVRAWEAAARQVRSLPEPLAEMLRRDGRAGLEALPHVGRSIASALDELLHRGRLTALERLKGAVSPEDLLATIPGLGAKLAERLHHELNIETLEELELAAHDGRLEQLDGFGPRRAKAIREILATRLARSSRRASRDLLRHERPSVPPPIGLLLDVDRGYRARAAAGTLRRIAPRRFNPGHEAWLPVMHDSRQGWHFTALFSNTQRAHELGKTHDWVVIYCERDGEEDQCTVVTEYRGDLAGKRAVRGRERECSEFYAAHLPDP